MATFADFYRQRMAELGGQGSTSSSPTYDFSGLTVPGRKVGEEPQSPLNWAIDILSRPLFGATNAVSNVIENADSAATKVTQGDPLGAIGEAFNVGNSPGAGFLEGFFSTDPSVKRTYSDVIEQTTDKFGAHDPNYVNEQDNVNPWVKGGVGLALDIAADPLTWIPGGVLLKGAKGVLQGAKAVTEGVRGGVDALKGAKVAETGAEAVSDGVPAVARQADDANPFADAGSEGVLPRPSAPAENPWDVLGRRGAEAYEGMRHNPADPAVQASYNELSKAVVKQYQDMKKAGIDISFETPVKGMSDIYKSSAEMLEDVTKNNRLRVLKTDLEDAGLPADHPMRRVVNVDGEDMVLNDLFRGVHDYMGHVKSGERGATVGFGPKGEWEAWRTHRLSLPRESWGALWSETRGQNNWTNYWANHGELPIPERPFAVQKAGLVDEELWTADLVKDETGIRTLREYFNDADGLQAMIDGVKDILGRTGAKVAGEPRLQMGQWLRENAKRRGVAQLPGDPTSKTRTLEQIAKIYQAEKAASGGAELSARGQAARAILDAGYRAYQEGADRASVGITNVLEAFQQARADRAEKLESMLGPELLNQLASKNTEASLQRALDNVLRALDPDTDLVKFYEQNKRLAVAVQNGLRVPSSVKPTANTVSEVQAVDTLLESERLAPVQEAMAKTFDSEIPGSEAFRQKYPYRGKGPVAYTDKDPKVRIGNRFLENNTYFQYTLLRNLQATIKQRIESVAKGRELYGKAAASARRKAMEDLGEDLVEATQTFGTKLFIGVGGEGVELYPVTFADVFKHVGAGFDDQNKALLALYNYNSAVAPTVLMQATHAAMAAGDLSLKSADEIAELGAKLTELILSPRKFGVRGGLRGAAGHMPNNIVRRKTEKGYANPSGYYNLKTKSMDKMQPGELVPDLVNAILKAQPTMTALAASNAAKWAERGLSEASTLSNAEIKSIRELIDSGAYKSAAVKGITEIPESVARQGTEIAATQDAVNAATEIATKAVGDAEVQYAKTQAKLDKAVKGATGPQKVATAVSDASQETFDDVSRQVDDVFDEIVGPGGPGVAADDIPALDLSGALPTFAQQGFVARALNGLGDTFNQRKGMERVWDIWHSKRTVAGQYIERKATQVRDLIKLSPEAQVAGMKAVQAGVVNANPEVAAAAAKIQEIMKGFWNLTDDAAEGRFIDHTFLAVEPNVGHINKVLDMKGLPEDMRFTEGGTLDDLMDGWREWDIKDPADFLMRMSDAAATVAEHRAIVGSFVNTFSKFGLVSKDFKPGMVRITASDKSTFAGLLPDGLYVDKGLAGELHKLDVTTRADRKMRGEVQHLLTNYYLPTQAIWKSLVTVWRPGHHIRNFNSNFFMQYVARGPRGLGSSQKDALKVLGVRNDYPEADILASLKSLGDEALPVGGDVIVSGRLGDITADEILRLFNDNGLRTSHTVSEDLLLDSLTKSPVTKAAQNLNKSKPGQVTGHVSQVVDHYGKMAHFIQILKQESGKYGQWSKKISKEEIIQRAVREVKRSHPDANMLTPTESKYRWIIPFYTWFAKTMPFAIESAARHPGRVAVFPKASYELAVAMGINPDSLIDPFPSDQLFPSFVTEGFFGPQFVGPNGEYINVNPGVQHFDLFREIGADPVRGLVGMTSPILRMPAELLTGGQMATGARINDTSDYIDQNLPLVNYLANVTGVSPTGSIGTLLSGQGLDPQAQVAKGSKGPLDQQLSALNFLFGANASNWSRQSFINSAEIEKRNREGNK